MSNWEDGLTREEAQRSVLIALCADWRSLGGDFATCADELEANIAAPQAPARVLRLAEASMEKVEPSERLKLPEAPMCDGNGECFRLRDELDAAREADDEHRADWHAETKRGAK